MKRGSTAYFRPTTYKRNATSRAASARVSKARYSRRNTAYLAKRQSLSSEKKGMDTIIASQVMVDTTGTNGSSTTLNLIQQGSGSWNRVGRQVTLKSIRLKGNIIYSYVVGATPFNSLISTCRMVLVWDKQPSGAAVPNFDTIFGCTAQDGTESTLVTSQLKYDNMGRFKILRDCSFTPPNIQSNLAVTANTVFAQIAVDEYVKLGNKVTIFSGQSAPMTIADISTGALYVYFRDCDPTAGSVWTTAVDFNCRLRYTDK